MREDVVGVAADLDDLVAAHVTSRPHVASQNGQVRNAVRSSIGGPYRA